MFRFSRYARLLAAASVAALAIAALPGHTPLASADEVYPRPASGTLTLVGRGYGHGRGMSQYGAMSAALRGQTWQQIINFYYPNTTRISGFTGTIRVGVQSKTGMTARVAMETGLTATSADGKVKTELPAKVGDVAVWSWQVALPNDTTNTTGVALRARLANGVSVQVFPTTSPSWTFSTPDATLTAMTSSGSKVATYLGTFRGVRAGSSVQPVVVTSLENYTRQVVPYENFGSWPVTAQAAQSVAARSYGAWYLTHPLSSRYDICDTTTCQVFGGLGAETANTKAGVAASAGVVIAIAGKPIRAEFGSSNGGWTVASNVVYQIAQADPWEGKLAPSAYTWSASVSAATIQAKWPTIGTFTRLVVTSRDGHGWWGGRVLGVRIEGTAGSVTRTGDQLRATLGLRSNYLTVADSPAALFRDVSGDGRPDFLSRSSTGRLLSTRSTSATTFSAPVTLGTSWGAYKYVFSGGLFGSDRYADVLSVDSTGTLRYHASYG
ncbi:MAG TPA: SpoIID/LytB domain-containing protein, partial [Propionibacteriaceae bacterium]|nr:SpoIID/LytB domain-containing protein [Propionibacteriaceae bacterium]